MRALILHANKFETRITKRANKPLEIKPEEIGAIFHTMQECLVVFFCVEVGDSEDQLNRLYEDIIKASEEVKTNNLMISPFVHLSNKIAEPEVAKQYYKNLMAKFDYKKFIIKSSPFGYHKTLLLDVKGHPGSFRYREFNNG